MQGIEKETYRLLEKLYHVQKMEQSELFLFVNHADMYGTESHASFLLRQGMIRVYDVGGASDGAGGHIGAKRFYEITLTGRAYVESTKKLHRKETVEWIRYIITTAIAVIALIKSFMPEILAILDRILPPA